jgi:hypothetical protein
LLQIKFTKRRRSLENFPELAAFKMALRAQEPAQITDVSRSPSLAALYLPDYLKLGNNGAVTVDRLKESVEPGSRA